MLGDPGILLDTPHSGTPSLRHTVDERRSASAGAGKECGGDAVQTPQTAQAEAVAAAALALNQVGSLVLANPYFGKHFSLD